jgi:hypothetical protein
MFRKVESGLLSAWNNLEWGIEGWVLVGVVERGRVICDAA